VLTLLALSAVPLALALRKVKLGGAVPMGHRGQSKHREVDMLLHCQSQS
jgi:hypothetical protein